MKVLHDWLMEYVGEAMPTAERVEELLTFHSFEIESCEHTNEHTVIDVDVLPNRSSDCLCHRGIARELASLLDIKLAHDPFKEPLLLPHTDALSITIADTDACRRFALAIMRGVKVGPSPEWLSSRLLALGQRSINNVVDATNYVMLALGQPLHAYDAGKFAQSDGVWRFGVRFARADETVRVLTGEEYSCDPRVQLIINADDDMPAGIAGIKGGAYAAIDEATTDIILEAANFDPSITRRASQFLRLQTDASKRFENEPARELVPYALEAVVTLISDIAGGICEGWADAYPTKQEQPAVDINAARVNALLGLDLPREEMRSILERIGASVSDTDDGFCATGPWERTDLTIEEDFIEEIGRVYGYGHVASVVPAPAALTAVNARQFYSEQIRAVLLTNGYSEVITSSFRKKDEVRLQNALASDKGYLRSSLRKNIEETLQKNMPLADLLGVPDIRVFEIGTVFDKHEGTVREHVALALGVRTKQTGSVPKDDALVQEAIEQLEAVLGISLPCLIEKGITELDCSSIFAQLPTPTNYEPIVQRSDIQYVPFSPYPFVSRDIALWVPGTPSEELRDTILHVLNDAAGDLHARTTPFDEFSKDGRTSYAFRLVFQSHEKTLTDDEVNEIMERVYSAATQQGWEVR